MQNNLSADLYEAEFNEDGRTALTGVAQWGFISAMVGLISLAINLLVMVVDVARFSNSGAVSALFGSLFTTAISLVLNLTLLAATQKIKLAMEQSDQEEFILGLSKLARYFKILGIITIIALVIFGIAAIFFTIVTVSKVSFS